MRSTRPTRAFTLLELLVAMGIMAVLIGLVVVSMHGIQGAAGRTESMNALRQMMQGYTSYTTDHRGMLMPGYLDEAKLTSLGITAKAESGQVLNGCNAGRCDASAYVWRLAPYLDYAWHAMMVDYASEPMVNKFTDEYTGVPSDVPGAPYVVAPIYGPGTADAAAGDLGISMAPAFGLNSIYLGGDSSHGGMTVLEKNPFDSPADTIAATRLSQVKNPARIIVFGASEQVNESLIPQGGLSEENDIGYVELRPPVIFLKDGTECCSHWVIDPEGEPIDAGAADAFTNGGGFPVARRGAGAAPVGHLDGSTEAIRLIDLGPAPGATPAARRQIMQHWWPFWTGF